MTKLCSVLRLTGQRTDQPPPVHGQEAALASLGGAVERTHTHHGGHSWQHHHL